MPRFRISLAFGAALLIGVVAIKVMNQGAVSAQGQIPAGPSGGLAVNVVGGSLSVNGTIAATQSGDWKVQVQSTETPVFKSVAPTCDFGNRCFVVSDVVPDGKILKVTKLHGTVRTNADGTVAFHLDGPDGDLLVALPSPHFVGAFHGQLVGFSFDTELIVSAGHKAAIEVAVGAGLGGIPKDDRNRIGLTGVYMDAPQ
jgi:hypothetical protein